MTETVNTINANLRILHLVARNVLVMTVAIEKVPKNRGKQIIIILEFIYYLFILHT